MMNNTTNNNLHGDVPQNSTMNPVTNLLESADPVAKNTAVEVVQFVDDAAIQEASLPKPAVVSSDILASGSESRTHHIEDVLSRYVKLKDITLTTTQNVDTDIDSFTFPDALLSASPNNVDKLTHFTFLRAHIEVRFVVNANSFQAGRWVAYFAPFSSALEIGDRVDINNYLGAKTVFPRVIINASSGMVGELLIPYASFYTHYDLARGIGDMGTVRITVLNKLSSDTAVMSVFARFVEPKVEIPTAVPLALGSLSSTFADMKYFIKNLNPIDALSVRSTFNEFVSRFLNRNNRYGVVGDLYNDIMPIAQVGDESTIKSSTGLISAPLKTLSGMSSMGEKLPLIGGYLAPVTWLTNYLAGAAEYFGLSKAQNLNYTQRMLQIPGFGFTNANGMDDSVSLSVSGTNSIGYRNDRFGSSMDEMDVSYIVSHESYLNQFTWTASDPADKVLSIIPIHPGVANTTEASGKTIFDSTALSYVASMARYWRGSIKYKIQATKTPYNSGRLRVSIIPSGNPKDVSTYDYNQGYSHIIDLRNSDEIEFNVPFISNTIWKPCYLDSINNPVHPEASTGIIVVSVINPLRQPSSAPSTISLNVYISGGHDMSFSVFDFTRYAPIKPVTTRSDEMPHAQVLGNEQDTGFNMGMEDANQVFDSSKMSFADAAATTMGEVVTNLRTVTRRFGLINAELVGNDRPYGYYSNYFGALSTSADTSVLTLSPINYISYLYRFYAGGKRVKAFVIPRAFGTQVFAELAVGYALSPTAPGISAATTTQHSTFSQLRSKFTHIVDTIYNRVIEVVIPYYSNTHASLVRGTGATVSVFGDRSSKLFLSTSVPYDTETPAGDSLEVYEAAHDDFTFGWLVGPPRLYELPTAITNVVIDDITEEAGTGGLPGYFIATVTTTGTPGLEDGNYNVIPPSTPAEKTLPITFTDASVINVRVDTGVVVVTNGGTKYRFALPYDTSLTVNVTATTTAWAAATGFTVKVNNLI